MIFFCESSHNRIALVVRPGYKDHPRDVIAAGILQHLWKEQFCQVHLAKIIGPHHHLKTIFQPTWLTQGHFALGFYKFSTFLWTKSNRIKEYTSFLRYKWPQVSKRRVESERLLTTFVTQQRGLFLF